MQAGAAGEAGAAEKALARAKENVEMQPQLAEPLYTLGVVQMQAGHNEDAVTSYETCLKIDPTHVGALVNGVS
eukprot:5354068-Prymnesium_polylepis.1